MRSDTPAAVIVSAATTPNSASSSPMLARLAEHVRKLGFVLPGLIVIGDIVAVRDRLLKLAAEVEAAR